MKNKFIYVVGILLLITLIAIYTVNSYRAQAIEAQKLNKQYEEYYGMQLLGSQLISLINKTIDINEKNEISKDDKGYYIDNEKNTIKLNIIFNYKNKTKTLLMEDIGRAGSEAFIRTYSTASFKCTKIERHQKTKNIKSLTFEEVVDG